MQIHLFQIFSLNERIIVLNYQLNDQLILDDIN